METLDMVGVFGGSVVVAAFLCLYADAICRQTPGLRQSRELLLMLSIFWMAMVPFKMIVLDVWLPPVDALMHESVARDIANLIQDGDFQGISVYLGMGNKAFRILLGIYYAVTNAPLGFTYAIFGGLSAWGAMALLRLYCQIVEPPRVPTWLTTMIVASPSLVFWSPSVLKEGPVFWGISMMVCVIARTINKNNRQGLLLPAIGFGIVVLMRPHIAAAWMAGIWIGGAVRQGKFSTALLGGGAMLGSLLVVQFVLPDLISQFSEVGIVETMNSTYELREGRGGSAIVFVNGAPTPVVDGFFLILFRPYPTECGGIDDLMAGAEVWLLTGLTIWVWMKTPNKLQLLLSPAIVSMLTSLILLAFFFTYSYNMGLMVRQRLQVFPASFALLALPAMMAEKRKSNLRRNASPAVYSGPTFRQHPRITFPKASRRFDRRPVRSTEPGN